MSDSKRSSRARKTGGPSVKKRKRVTIAPPPPTVRSPSPTPKKRRLNNPFEGLLDSAPPLPSLGTRKYTIQSSDDWTSWYKDTYHGDIRPATSQLEVRYKTSSTSDGLFEFNISNREDPKNRTIDVKLNPFFTRKGVQDIYYSKENPKFTKVGKKKRNKVALDNIPDSEQSAYAKDVLRVTKGKAYTKGLESGHTETALLTGSLISTSERGRNPYNPINAHIELYKVKHGQRNLSEIFHIDTGTFVAGRAKGAETSRELVTREFLGTLINDEAMRKIYDTRIKDPGGAKHGKHGTKSFEEWVEHKATKWTGYYPAKK